MANPPDLRADWASPQAVSGILTPRVNHRARVPLKGMRGVLTMDMEMIVDLSRAQPGWQCQGVVLNDLNQYESVSPVAAAFRLKVLEGAKRFVRDLERQGYQLLTPEGELQIWGPYHSRNWKQQRDGSMKAHGRRADELLFDDAVDFIIRGDFLQTRTILTEFGPGRSPKLSAAEREAINAAMWPTRPGRRNA